MNSPSSASPSLPGSATLASNFGGDAPAQTESSVPDVITIKDNSGSQVYNIELREKPERPFDMEFKPANDSVQVKSFAWYISDPTKAKPEKRNLTVFAKAEVQNGILFHRSDASKKTFVCLNVTDVHKDYHDELNKAMVIGIHWTVDKQEGETLSKAFSITPNTGEEVSNDVWGKVLKSYYNISREESIPSGGSGSGGHNGLTPPNNSSDDKNSTGNGISDIPTIGGNSSSSQTHNRGRGGLGTGAIAGIAVGVAALLAAALGIIFFLRRRRGRGTPSTTALHHTHAAEQEKLSSFAKGGVAGGGASASDAAIAPYRDDNSTLTNSHDRRRSSAATGRVVVAPGEDVARDQQPSPPKTTTAAAAESRHSRTTGNGVSRHLVEEGMTAEEIRRLEEEEAQLDDEIQRANGRRR
ncbi:hypothetical protein BBO_06651 [Beauveria brongniartii RCEF 3172]|uniref:Uncharacterized protein n=1 Tax=Beauveria brongniartii RCEF 3172 TaxID=1081107 RepID=A0A169YFM5_9HYPO|nr:hypothetical protein BBO_06651 [Beauveria brongniartii RCEF 3172]